MKQLNKEYSRNQRDDFMREYSSYYITLNLTKTLNSFEQKVQKSIERILQDGKEKQSNGKWSRSY